MAFRLAPGRYRRAQCVFLGIDTVFDEAAVGADDPPAGPVDPANPAGLGLEDGVVELENDPPMTAASTPSQGLSSTQAASRRHGPRPNRSA